MTHKMLRLRCLDCGKVVEVLPGSLGGHRCQSKRWAGAWRPLTPDKGGKRQSRA